MAHRRRAKKEGRAGAEQNPAAKRREKQKAAGRAEEAGIGKAGARKAPADNRLDDSRGFGKLTVVATPIGNLGDLSLRAAQVLLSADVIAAEDTRVTGKLLSTQGIKKPMVRLDEHASAPRISALVRQLSAGGSIALVSDAGTPGISDPGVALVNAAHQAGIPVDAIPGPSAATNALALSGFYAQRYAFLGYLPRTGGRLRAELAPFRNSPYALVCFESPFRTEPTLKAALEVLGDRRVAVCREMTKLHQEIIRGRLSELIGRELRSKGEYTIVFEGRRR